MLKEYNKFSEELKRVLNNYDILESGGFTPEVPEYQYVGVDIALPRYEEVTNFSKVTKLLKYSNGIPIGRSHEIPFCI